MEEWREIPETNGLYSASSIGRVRSEPAGKATGRQRGRILTPTENRKGYLVFRVCLLTAEDVRSIRAIYPSKSLGELAVMFGVKKSAVWAIVHRKTWAHV